MGEHQLQLVNLISVLLLLVLISCRHVGRRRGLSKWLFDKLR